MVCVKWFNCLVCESYLHKFIKEKMIRIWKGLTLALSRREDLKGGGHRGCGLLGEVTHGEEGS